VTRYILGDHATLDSDCSIARRYGTAGASTGATGAADLGFKERQVLIDDIAGAIRGGHDPFVPLASVLPALDWALPMYQSAKEGGAVELPIDEDRVW
jgi:hypothetical protein